MSVTLVSASHLIKRLPSVADPVGIRGTTQPRGRILDQGKADGAKAIVGGNRWGDTGYYVEPTVVTNTTPEMSIVQEDIFGPVAISIPFSNEDEVIAATNDSECGLAAALWTTDLSRAHRVATRLQAGSVWINTYHALDSQLPFGGYHQSGWGRELGPESIELTPK